MPLSHGVDNSTHARREMHLLEICRSMVDPDCLVIIPDASGFKLGFSFDALRPGSGDTPDTYTLYLVPRICPRPSHEEDCPVCMSPTQFQTDSSLAYDFPCGHVVCWQCVTAWAAESESSCQSLGVSCPMCRQRTPPGNYYDIRSKSVLHTDLFYVSTGRGDMACITGTLVPPPQLRVATCTIEIIYSPGTGWSPEYTRLPGDDMRHIQHRKKLRRTITDCSKKFGKQFPDVTASTRNRCKHMCFVCGATGVGVKVCPCHMVAYCSSACQRLHFKTHRAQCKAIRRGNVDRQCIMK